MTTQEQDKPTECPPSYTSLPKTNYTWMQKAGYVYGGFVFLGFCRGTFSGCHAYYSWLKVRKPVSINYKLYEPTVNTIRDVGYWSFYTMQGGVGSALIAATAPISVPLMIKFGKQVADGKSAN